MPRIQINNAYDINGTGSTIVGGFDFSAIR
jgi:hypothetical protein